ncbi:[Fe-Fe] hydrogenase large subunit C-terminal domain-containing protein [Caloramator quimbayensis]|uniref:[Fe-Fe] hydrogenase large subunit C-terminal domain-containing protein n=1 Tax=Caloramator quimbayensis TaxID=1147123 RepID=UPI0009995BFA|nr:[Fe-Fe] hydrogenase large subunit C-terminal domain-containing protein [Caloramator quimbayensis]
MKKVPNDYYIDIFRKLVKAYNEGTLKEKYEELIEKAEDENAKKYIFAAMGLDYIKNASFEDIKKAMDMKKMKGKIVVKVGDCGIRCIDKDGFTSCQKACPFGAVDVLLEKNISEINDKCIDCGNCIAACDRGNLIDKIEFLPIVQYLESKEDVYAIIAPAYIGQFGENVTVGKLRKALKAIGFKDMIEVALFADILTLKEAVEFHKHVNKQKDFMITSCCCPMWVAMIKKLYSELVVHVAPSVSPMVACGRTIKKLHKNSKVVFIGPCVAKKAEAKENDLNDAVDFVLTFKELQEIFDILGINPENFCEDEGEHASRAGRIYAYTGGVSKAVYDTVNKLFPDRSIKVKAVQGNGVKECKDMLQKILDEKLEANFLEGMGCVGGCVGGPKSILSKDEGRKNVQEYGNQTDMITPIDNPCVYAVLKEIGINDIYELVDEDKAQIFERRF